MTVAPDPSARDRWTRLRFAIIGPLLAAPPEPGALHATLTALAAKVWRHPLTGLDLHCSFATLERWYYAARGSADPVAALQTRLRDVGHFPSLSPTAIATLQYQYREHPGWSMQLHVDNLRVVLKDSAPSVPSYPTIRRYLRAQGMFKQARPKRATDGALAARDRLEQFEVRSFEVDHVGALWHLDFHHGSRRVVTAAGAWAKPFLLGVLDDRSRLVCHLQWYLEETVRA